MRWRNRQRSSNVEDRRGRKALAGGGLGFLGVALVVMLLGGDPSLFLQEGLNRTIQSVAYREEIPQEQQDELVEFISVVLAETEDTWNQRFAAQGLDYPEPVLVFFTGAVSSGCGRAQAAIGPFYCPADQKIYLDLNFFHDLAQRHDAPGDFAQAYVIAHEVGHHVQNIRGILDRAPAGESANQASVRTELMADCLAGIWAFDTRGKNLLEEGDVEEALRAASQIGDDVLQQQAQGYVVPDSFTHGTGEQRYRWFSRGYQSGNIAQCDTFGG